MVGFAFGCVVMMWRLHAYTGVGRGAAEYGVVSVVDCSKDVLGGAWRDGRYCWHNPSLRTGNSVNAALFS